MLTFSFVLSRILQNRPEGVPLKMIGLFVIDLATLAIIVFFTR